MNRTSKGRRRLGVAGLAAVTFASPLLLALPAYATAGTVTLEDPVVTASYRSDGSNNNVHLYATIGQATGVDPQVNRVRFTQKQTSGVNPLPTTATTICTDASAPFACEFTPTSPGTYDIAAEAREANDNFIASDTRPVTVQDNASAAHFTRPPGLDGGPAGYYAFFGGAAGPGRINVAGTRSSDRPGLTVTAGNTQSGTPGDPDTDAGGAGLVPAGAGDQSWATDIELPTTPGTSGNPSPPTGDTATTDTDIKRLRVQTDAATSVGLGSQEVVPAQAYLQKLTTLTVTPSSTSAQPGAAAVNQKIFTVVARDQKGNPISKLGLTIAKNTGSQAVLAADDPGQAANGQSHLAPTDPQDATVANRCNNRTDPNGQYRFKASDPAAEQSTFTITSNFNNDVNCTKDNAVDFTVTATLNTIQNASTATVSIVPNLPIYDTVQYGNDPAGSPTEYPVAKVRVNDQNGQPITNGPSGTVVQRVRTFNYCGPNTTVNPTNCGVTNNPETTSADAGNTDNDGDVQLDIPPMPATDRAGADVFTLYIEKTGTPGFQAGDTLVGSATLKFGPPKIFFQPCDQQTFSGTTFTTQTPPTDCGQSAQAGQNETVAFRYTVFDGATFIPVASRAIDVTVTDTQDATTFVPFASNEFGFTTTQPSGTTRNSATSATATTNSDGVGSTTLSATKTGTVDLLASDPSLGSNTFEDATSTVTFRNNQVVLTTANNQNAFEVSPTNFFGGSNVGSPGAPLLSQVQLRDQNNQPLRNEPVTLTTTAGFFTPLPNNRTVSDVSYANLSFTSPPANNAVINGDLTELGKTLNTVTDDTGIATFLLGIKRDAGFDDDGRVNGTVTATMAGTSIAIPVGQNGPNGTGAAPSVGGVLFSTDAQQFNVTLVNPSATNAMEVRQGTFDNRGNFALGTGKPGGDAATARDNGIPSDRIAFVVFQRDVFGNLVNTGNLNVTETGPGEITPGDDTPSGAYNDVQNEIVLNDPFVVIRNLANANPQTGLETVTIDWAAPNNTFLVGANGQRTTNNGTRTITDNFQLNWYVREVAGLKFTTSLTPASAQNNGTVQTGSTVGVSVLVVDAKNRPVQNLGVQFFTAGPGSATTQSVPCNPTSGGTQEITTDVSGRAGYQFASNTPGRSTITTVITDNGCSELGRDVRTVDFTGQGGPGATGTVTINGPALTRVSVGTTVAISGKADPGSKVNIFFRKRGTTVFNDLRDLTADGSGNFSTTYRALDDYKYFAAVGSSCPASKAINASLPSGCVASREVLTQAVPYFDGPSLRVVKKGSTVTLTGHYVVGTDALLALTRNQQIVATRFGKALGGGRFSVTFVADKDYRFYVLRKSTDSRAGLLSWVVQAH